LTIGTSVGEHVTLIPDAAHIEEDVVTLVVIDLGGDLLRYEATLVEVGIL